VQRVRAYRSIGSKTRLVMTSTTFAYVVGTVAIVAVRETSTNTVKNASAKIPNSRKKKRKVLAANAQANVVNQFTRAINTATTKTIIVHVLGTVAIVVVARTTTNIAKYVSARIVSSSTRATHVSRRSRESAGRKNGRVTRIVTMKTTTLVVLGMAATAVAQKINIHIAKSANV